MAESKNLLKEEYIQTMKKDIDWIQSGGRPEISEFPVFAFPKKASVKATEIIQEPTERKETEAEREKKRIEELKRAVQENEKINLLKAEEERRREEMAKKKFEEEFQEKIKEMPEEEIKEKKEIKSEEITVDDKNKLKKDLFHLKDDLVELLEIIEAEKKKENLYSRFNALNRKIKEISENEEKIEKDERIIERKERTNVDLKERKKIEEKRWQIQRERRRLEKEKWQLEEEKARIESEIKRSGDNYKNLQQKSEELDKRIKKIEEDFRAEAERIKEQKNKQKQITEEKERHEQAAVESPFFPEKQRFLELEERLEKLIKRAEEKEIFANSLKKNYFEKEEMKKKEKMKEKTEEIKSPSPAVPQKRNLPETERKEMDWEIEQAKRRIESFTKDFSKEEKEISKTSFPEPFKEEEKESHLFSELEKKRRELLSPSGEFKEKFFQSSVPSSSLSHEEKQQSANSSSGSNFSPPTGFPPSSGNFPKKPGFFKKFLIRFLIIFLIAVLLFFISTFIYWYFVVKPKSKTQVLPSPSPFVPEVECLTDSDCSLGKFCSPAGTCVEKEIVIPESLFSVEQSKKIEISAFSEIPEKLSLEITDWQNQGKFERIVFIKQDEKRIISLKEILENLGVNFSDDFYQKISNNYIFFIYSQEQGSRLGWAVEISEKEGKEEVKNLMKEMEKTMKKDFEFYFSLMESGVPPSSPVIFRNSSKIRGYSGPDFRYLTLAKNDLGICYFISDKEIVFSSSFESIKKVAELLLNNS